MFEDPAPAAVAAAVEAHCRERLGSEVAGAEFFDAGVGSVYGLRLADGRGVVLKVHGPRAAVDFLAAVDTVKRRLFEAGFPAPEPLLPPMPLAGGRVTTETLLDAGERADAHDPAVRQAMAAGLARFVELARPLTGLGGLRRNPMEIPPGRLWPVPHDGRFDFEGTSAGADWIDRIARRALADRSRSHGDLVVGHMDWRVQNLGFADPVRLSAVYDWDSVGVVREPVLVGSVAHAFTTNWAEDDWRQFPSLEESRAFVADYEAARGASFGESERRVLQGSLVYTLAYTARCEHSDQLTDFGRSSPDPRREAEPSLDSARALLPGHARELLEQTVR